MQPEMFPIVQAAVRPSEVQKEMLGALSAVYGAMRMALFPPFMPGGMRFGKRSLKDWDFLALRLIFTIDRYVRACPVTRFARNN
jgi:hypothetical protein